MTSGVQLNVNGRVVEWDIPDEVAVVMLQSFVQVCGPAKREGVVSESGVWTRQQLIDALRVKQHELCAEATIDGDGQGCDCRYNPGIKNLNMLRPGLRGEITGCCEMRAAIRILEALEKRGD